MDYQIKPIGKTCAASGDALEPGAKCHSALVQDNGHFVRLDFRPELWAGPPEGTVAHWTCRVPASESQSRPALDSETLMGCFEQMWEDSNPSRESLLYLIALMLIQKRRIRIDGTRDTGGEQWLQLSGSQGEGPWEIRDQELSDEEIEQLQIDLNQQLHAA